MLGCVSCDASAAPEVDPRVNSRTAIGNLPDWHLAETPDLSIGVREGEPAEVFGSIRAGAFGPKGIYVLDGSYREVRVFDLTGRHVMSLGGEGRGPGEFQNPTELVVGSDSTIAVWDRGLLRLTVFGPDGELLRTASVRQNFMNPALQSVVPDGSFILSDLRYPDIQREGVGTQTVGSR